MPEEQLSSAADVCKQVVQLYSFCMLNSLIVHRCGAAELFLLLLFPVGSDMQLGQLLSGNSGGRIGERTGGLLGFRKGDDVTD